MKKRFWRVILIAVSVLVLALSLAVSVSAAGRGAGSGTGSGNGPGQQNRWGQTGSRGNGGSGDGQCTASVVNVQVTPLSEGEIQWLTYMSEEEKLARDVYLALYDKWGMRIFNNIAASEQKHMDAILTLLERYEITDPSLGPGEFTPESGLQDLYDELISKGKLSLIDALEVGIIIEETDIEDLNDAIAATEHTDIINVYSNLLQGSLNHLNAFESNLAKQ